MSIDFRAVGSGYFRVYVRDEVFLSQHTKEPEACQQCVNAHLADPSSKPYYRHEAEARGVPYRVDLLVTAEEIVVPPPAPPPPSVTPDADAVDLADVIAQLPVDMSDSYRILTDDFWAGLQVSIDRSLVMPLWKVKPVVGSELRDGVEGPARLVAFCWRGVVLCWRFANVRVLIQGR